MDMETAKRLWEQMFGRGIGSQSNMDMNAYYANQAKHMGAGAQQFAQFGASGYNDPAQRQAAIGVSQGISQTPAQQALYKKQILEMIGNSMALGSGADLVKAGVGMYGAAKPLFQEFPEWLAKNAPNEMFQKQKLFDFMKKATQTYAGEQHMGARLPSNDVATQVTNSMKALKEYAAANKNEWEKKASQNLAYQLENIKNQNYIDSLKKAGHVFWDF